MSDLTVQPARSLQGTLILPGDKSISHRALLVGALAEGTTRIFHWLDSEDIRSTWGALEALGVKVRQEGEALIVEGKGPRGLKPPAGPLQMGNSGTTTRLLLGILAGCPFSAKLEGDASLSSRPMRRVTEPLARMGAKFEIASAAGGGLAMTGEGVDRLPLTVHGGRLKGIRYAMPVASAQVKSALLLAGLSAEGPTTVVEPSPTRDHTERILALFGAKIEIASPPLSRGLAMTGGGNAVTVEPGAALRGREITVPGDFSSAAFFLVAAALLPGSSVTVKGVGLNPTRTALLDLLKQMGAKVKVRLTPGSEVWEPAGEVTVSASELQGIAVEPELIPRVIDELPVFMVAAAQARGRTVLKGVGELRVKETDRIDSMVKGLSAMGARIQAEREEVVIEGPSSLHGAALDSLGDHRTGMALAIAGLAAQGPTTVRGSEWFRISFPGFAEALESLRR